MTKKATVIIFLFIMIMHSLVINAGQFSYVEIFDPKQDKVVKVVQVNTEIHKIVAGLIKSVDGIYGKNDPLTDDGYAIKIPLSPAVKVQGEWLNTLVHEVYVIIPEKQPPFFMVFENEDKVMCFSFEGNINELSRVLDFKLKVDVGAVKK